jgi:Uncharacterized protein conserved in archaea
MSQNNYLTDLFRLHIPAAVQVAASRIQKEALPDITEIKELLKKLDPEAARDAVASSATIAAIPTTGIGAEHPWAVFEAPESSAGPSVGVDGSQIYPNERDILQWGLVRVVSVDSTGKTEEVHKFLPDEVVSAIPGKSRALTDAERDTLEASLIHDLSENPEYSNHLILKDGGLLPWAGIDAGFGTQAQEYNQHMSAAIQTGLVAGVVSHPRSKYLYNLLKAAFPNESLPLFTDNALMTSHLKIGERSAVFMHGSALNPGGAGAVYYFYLRVSQIEVMRVEIPATVAFNQTAVEKVQATLLENSKGLGYPAVLIEAHEQVKIAARVAHDIQQQARLALLKVVGPDALPAFSVKEILKGDDHG